MSSKLRNRSFSLKKLMMREEGQDLVEYALIISLIASVLVSVVAPVAPAVMALIARATTALNAL
jgi:Flp pilus assembly pilin Flp